MASGAAARRLINLRLIHNGVQPGSPLSEPMRFGLQDVKGEVHAGTPEPGDLLVFDFAVEVKDGGKTDRPTLRGAFLHGGSADRFLYLSWKREGKHEHPWCWRIKVPLSGIGFGEIGAVEKCGGRLVTNVVSRRPHSSEAVEWRVDKSD